MILHPKPMCCSPGGKRLAGSEWRGPSWVGWRRLTGSGREVGRIYGASVLSISGEPGVSGSRGHSVLNASDPSWCLPWMLISSQVTHHFLFLCILVFNKPPFLALLSLPNSSQVELGKERVKRGQKKRGRLAGLSRSHPACSCHIRRNTGSSATITYLCEVTTTTTFRPLSLFRCRFILEYSPCLSFYRFFDSSQAINQASCTPANGCQLQTNPSLSHH